MTLTCRICFVFAAAWLALATVVAAPANDPRPVVGPGATKDDVIAAYGWPNGQSKSGTKEILSYAQGEVTLENGRVERVDFSPNVPWQAPRPRPGPATASTRKTPEAPIDYWTTSYETALQQAQQRHCRILALFTGSDWSPASQEFQEQVENHPDFVNAFAGDFVFLKLDYPRGAPVPAKISDENLKLRDRYDVTTYPSLLVLAPSGERLGRADLTKTVPGQSFRDRVIGAVRAVRDATAGFDAAAPESKPAAASVAPSPEAAPSSATGTTPSTPVVTEPKSAGKPGNATATASSAPLRVRGLSKAMKLVLVALLLGAAMVGAILWWIWRRPKGVAPEKLAAISDRIDAAASGLPSAEELNNWPQEKLCAVTAALAEFDDYTAHIRPTVGDVDIELRKRGDMNPRVLVCCAPGSVGVIPAKRVRELFASLAAEGAESGWFVAPAGFTPEAKEYAAAHRIVLIGIDGLQNMMRDVPPVSLPGLLARG